MIFVLGDIVLDILVRADGPQHYGSDTPGTISMQGGGSAANFAAWTAYLGEKVRFSGKIGNDSFGQDLKKELETRGVATSLPVSTTEATGKILVFVDHLGERTMITDRGANLAYRPEELPELEIQSCSHLHLTGYGFFGSAGLEKTAQRAIRVARGAGLSVSIDPSSYALLKEYGAETFIQRTSGCNILFPNVEEGRVLSGLQDEEEIVDVLSRDYPTVVLKLGERGCLLRSGGETLRVAGGSSTLERTDSTGAGDAFAAAFVTEYLRDPHDLERAARMANTVANGCLSRAGGRPPKK